MRRLLLCGRGPALAALSAAGFVGVRPRRAHGDEHQGASRLFAAKARPAACEAKPPLRELYPEIAPRQTGLLETADGKHQLYFEVSGNPSGKAVLFLHGGPGDGSSPKHRRLFDPSAFKIVVFDQRGSGKSLPAGSLDANTTPKLLEDCEQLRRHLGVEKWDLVVGGSWGSTLALAYAQAHPGRVSGMVLYSVFLPSRQSIDQLYNGGPASEHYPEAFDRFVSHLPVSERANPLQAYHRRICGGDDATRLAAQASLSAWLLHCLALTPDERWIAEVTSKPEESGDGSKVELHYMANGCFLGETQLLDGCSAIAKIPCKILHGRWDIMCLPSGAWRLHKALPLSSLCMVPESGHSSSAAPRLKSEVIDAIDGFR